MSENKGNTNEFVKSIKYFKNRDKLGNECQLDMFQHLLAISITGSWKKETFYKGVPELSHYSKKKFTAVMKDLYGKSSVWFSRIIQILDLPNGRNLFLTHGRENMIAYLAYSDDEQIYVLEASKKRPGSTFHSLLQANGMRGQKDKNIDKEKNSAWKKKYHNLEKKYKKLQEKYRVSQKENRDLKRKQSQVNKIFESRV